MAERGPLRGAVIVPAHNEEVAISRNGAFLAELTRLGVEVIVAANGCTDGTVRRAREVPGARVLDLAGSSKTAAMNASDEVTTAWPRLYLDADVSITTAAVGAVFAQLESGTLAARPTFRYDTGGCTVLVRAYYRARLRVAGMQEHLWGAGAYALSREGHRRLGVFPDLLADDLYVDQLFDRAEKVIVVTDPVVVRCPRTVSALLGTLSRVQRGRSEVAATQEVRRVGGPKPVLAGVQDVRSLADALIYIVLATAARWPTRRSGRWQRDDTSRAAEAFEAARSEGRVAS